MFQNECFVIIIKKTKTMVICRLILGIFGDFQNFQISRFQIPENMEILWKLPFLTNCNILGIFPTQYWSLSLVFYSEFLNHHFPGISRFQIPDNGVICRFEYIRCRKCVEFFQRSWQKPMSSYKMKIFLGVCPFLQIRVE